MAAVQDNVSGKPMIGTPTLLQRLGVLPDKRSCILSHCQYSIEHNVGNGVLNVLSVASKVSLSGIREHLVAIAELRTNGMSGENRPDLVS